MEHSQKADLNSLTFIGGGEESKEATAGAVDDFLFYMWVSVHSLVWLWSLRVYLYRDREKESKEQKKGSASIWYIYASLPLW